MRDFLGETIRHIECAHEPCGPARFDSVSKMFGRMQGENWPLQIVENPQASPPTNVPKSPAQH